MKELVSDGKTILLLKAFHGVQPSSRPPHGLIYVSGTLAQAGFEPVIKQYCGNSVAQLRADLVEVVDDCLYVGFSVSTGAGIADALLASGIVQEMGLPVVWGGIHPTTSPETTRAHRWIDVAVIGEGEIPAVSLATELEKDSPDFSKIRWCCAALEPAMLGEEPCEVFSAPAAQDRALVCGQWRS